MSYCSSAFFLPIRHYVNIVLQQEAAQAKYLDPKSVRILDTKLGRMAGKMACNEPLMNVSVPIQWFGRGATAAAGYQSVGTIIKYQGQWQPPAGCPPYVSQKQPEYGHHQFFMQKNEV